jgi:hypothetical protein
MSLWICRKPLHFFELEPEVLPPPFNRNRVEHDRALADSSGLGELRWCRGVPRPRHARAHLQVPTAWSAATCGLLAAGATGAAATETAEVRLHHPHQQGRGVEETGGSREPKCSFSLTIDGPWPPGHVCQQWQPWPPRWSSWRWCSGATGT